MTSQTQQDRSEQSAEERRRKRKERAAKSRTPEPKDIVSGAGQPLDPGVRRELEEQLGHDLSRVRLHTGRDAGQLTDLLGADAVAVGQDVFFREGAYRPGTAEGHRLLAHELLHTVQNPHGLGALRAGRELGAVSLPQQAIEREAESAAQDLARPEAARDSVPEVEEGQATPGWLRYATVDADRRRMEALDPATLVDRVANGILRSLRGDPEDWSGRVRIQLAQMAPEVQDTVLDRLEVRLPAPVIDRLLEVVEETEQAGPLPMEAAAAPLAVPGAAEEIEEERAGEESEAEAGDSQDRERDVPENDNGRPGGGQQDGRTAPGGGRDEAAGGRDGSMYDAGQENAQGGAGSPTRQQESAKQQQERSQDQQEDKDASGRDAQKDAAEEGKDASDTEREQQDQDKQDERDAGEDADSPDEAAQEPEKQAVEQEQRQDAGAGEVAGRQAAAPGAVDRSGAEPGEKSRTGGDSGMARTAGDPENQQDADDEPLGLESESEQDGAEQERGSHTPASASLEPVPDVDLVGYTDAAKNPNLVEERRKGTAPLPSLSSVDVAPAPDTAPQATEPDTSRDAASRAEEEAGDSESFEDILSGTTDAQDAGLSGIGDGLGTASPGAEGGTSVSDVGGADGARKQADERKEDAEDARRDEEARASDAAATGAAAAVGEPAAPDQLARAGEDARTQGAGSPSSEPAPAEGTGRADTAGKPEAGKPDRRGGPETSAGADKAQKQDDAAAEDPASIGASRGASGADQGKSDPETPAPSEGDVTEGKGPATSSGPGTGPDHVSTPGPAAAPKLTPGNGPPASSAGPEARTNTPKATESPGSGGSSGGSTGSRARPTGSKRQAARQAARTVSRRGGGGGGRTAPAPAPVRAGGRSGGRPAVGGSKPKKEAPAPDVSNATPESGLATAGSLKPHQAVETLKGVDGAVGRSVEKERTALRKAPPTTQRPSGSPRTVPGGPTASAPGTYTNAKVARTKAAPGQTPEITGEQKPEGEVPGANVPEPSWWDIAVTIGAQLFGRLLKEILPLDDLIDSILGLPTKDEGLQNARVGDAPRLPLENDSDPQRTDEQSQKLDERKTELHQAGREDAARPMGEDQIYPDVPKETLTGKVPGGKKTAGAGGARSVSGGGVPIESASAVAEHDRGPQIQAGFAQGHQKMTQERQAKDKKATQDRQQHDRDLQREVTASSKKQAEARDQGRSDIADSRDNWRKEQDDKAAEIDGKKGKKYEQVRKDIDDKQEQTDKDVDKRTEDDNQRIEDEQTNAEQEAEQKQEDGKSDADNWLEEAIEKLKEFFEELKNAIKSIFERARQVVTDLIEEFKAQVFKLIDDARNWVIDQINLFADALIALGDELLADYPAMRDKWRNTINEGRDWAVQKVNEAADALKEVAGTLLDGLCGALLAGLDVLESGMLAAVDIAETVTVGALEFGAAAVAALGEWAAIFNDIVSDPGDWISKAGAAAETGAKEYLFEEIKTAVKAWFNQKVQEIIGIPMEDFQELISGGVTVEQMAQMAWDEALPQLPLIIGVLVVEKVVARLIPGAGWVMAIIDALQTAWGALSEILAAFGLFMDFLKAVKSGNGALPFAKAVAAGVVALLELVYQFLIEGVSRFMGKVAERLGDMLKNLRQRKPSPGPSGSPDQPGTPTRPRDQEPTRPDDRTPDSGRPNDRPADRVDDRPASRPTPRKPTRDQASRPPSRPRPGKRPAPEKKPRPAHTTRPKKRRDDEERRNEGREVNAARRRMRDAERRTRDEDRDERSGGPTRRGPARDTLRPDRRRPGTDDRDHDLRNTRPGSQRPNNRRRPDDDRRTDQRPEERNRDRRSEDREKDRRPADRPRPLRRARQTIKSAVNRARRAAHRLFGRARRTLGSRLNDRLRRLRNQWRRTQDRTRDRDRARERTRDRGRQLEPEGRTDYDLPTVRFRTVDGATHTLLFDGKGKSADLAMRTTLASIKSYIDNWGDENNSPPISEQRDLHTDQETARKRAEAQRAIVEAAQDRLPDREVGKGRGRRYRSYGEPIYQRGGRSDFDTQLRDLQRLMERLAELLERRSRGAGKPPLPEPILPPFSDGTVAQSFRASYIQKKVKRGTEATERPDAWPLGWDRIVARNLGAGAAWVRMHVLTALLGGHASTSNLVPARKADNEGARDGVEHPAARAIGKLPPNGPLEDMIWYDVNVILRNQYPGFPRQIYMRWGTYHYPKGYWERKPGQSGQWKGQFDRPPWSGSAAQSPLSVNLNTGNQYQIRAALKISVRWVKTILHARSGVGSFSGMGHLETELLKNVKPAGRRSREQLIGLLKKAEIRGKIVF
ncbi:eCIS core domain-containing protein [Streptomyces bluensis]|uniref:eCIS core domain-containing protein n=1 Tax=Streptomyces bluensis TaxID=33897 RepID=UPI0016735D0B|nr:DUF4157 domain-containing protein [Streptomyces bluensis]GGZ61612.1 hypothetical protein GCM10010344_29780 [Streptomyces bluensis]